MHSLTVAELSAGLAAGRFSSLDLALHFLGRIERLGPALNAFVTVTADRALDDARRADERRARGEAGPLTGVPVAHKDIFCTDGILTTCSSRMLSNFVAPYDAAVVERWRAAGMVLLGKTNMDEFAMGSSNETSHYGPVRNPWDPGRVPGGSSGGSAAAVAACLAPAASGTDTGGSIRQPAALTNLTGLKPTYGRVSRYGMIAFASSLDQAGVLTRSAEDAALLLGAMAGFDARDSTSVDAPVPDYHAALATPLAGLRVGIIREFFDQGLDARVGRRVQEAIEVLRAGGAILREVSLPALPLSVPTYYVVAPAECSSNLSRFDGVRFGHRCDSPRDHHDRHLRALGRLLRCLLPQGAEGAAADRRRFRAGLRRGRRGDRAHGTDACVRARRQDQRSDHDVPERHLHHRRQPRRTAGNLDSVRLRHRGRTRAAGRPAARRTPLLRGAAARRLAPVPAADRLAPSRPARLPGSG
jgi:aspartyl-tRNA(Asn)/glutamyl-tRNA(Gln) amidotransferase subunit A